MSQEASNTANELLLMRSFFSSWILILLGSSVGLMLFIHGSCYSELNVSKRLSWFACNSVNDKTKSRIVFSNGKQKNDFFPVSRTNTLGKNALELILSIACHLDYECAPADVKCAFRWADLTPDEKLYTKIPENNQDILNVKVFKIANHINGTRERAFLRLDSSRAT